VVARFPDGRSVFDVDYRGPVAILIGGEGAGLPRSIAKGPTNAPRFRWRRRSIAERSGVALIVQKSAGKGI
jgi:hypothetical protein